MLCCVVLCCVVLCVVCCVCVLCVLCVCVVCGVVWCGVVWCVVVCVVLCVVVCGVAHWKNPCADSKRPRVCIQNVPVYAGTTRTCVSTRTPWILPIQGLRTGREQHVPDSSNHSLYLTKLVGSSYLGETLEGTSNQFVRFFFRTHENKYHERFAGQYL